MLAGIVHPSFEVLLFTVEVLVTGILTASLNYLSAKETFDDQPTTGKHRQPQKTISYFISLIRLTLYLQIRINQTILVNDL